MSPTPDLSVVVPTRDRPHLLDRVPGRALADQDVDRPYEVVVVDDASHDADAVATVVGRYDVARLLRGEGRGPAAARNRGAHETAGPVARFTDDDCRPGRGWLRSLGADASTAGRRWSPARRATAVRTT
ncbi:MAG: glycosyltransferase family A protein [Acidimicrobiia bacterium]|nr:glycosyltransferase family A protein [Acidimicrobiia bacterium]